MSKTLYTKEQIAQLSGNENIARCSERSITYNQNFKIRAVKLYAQGKGSMKIFAEAGLGIRIIGRRAPKECLRRWNRLHKAKGLEGLMVETRGRGGGRPKTKKNDGVLYSGGKIL